MFVQFSALTTQYGSKAISRGPRFAAFPEASMYLEYPFAALAVLRRTARFK